MDQRHLYTKNKKKNSGILSEAPRKKLKKKRNIRRIYANIIGSLIMSVSLISVVIISSLSLTPFEAGADKNALASIEGSSENVVYVMICGINENDGEGLPDVMMVACLDIKNKTANILQFPRDIYTGPEPNTGGTTKLNAIYSGAGKGASKIGTLMSYYNNYFGMPIDHYILIELKALRKIVDIVGGVDITLTRDLTLENFRTGKRTIKLNAGTVTLDGNKAESFMRERRTYKDEGDTGRIKAQRSFYAGLAKKIKGMSMNQMLKVAQNCFSEIKTDMNLSEMLGYAKIAKEIDMDKMGVHYVPTKDKGQVILPGVSTKINRNGLYLLSMDMNAYIDLVYEYMNPYDDIIYEKIQPYQVHTGEPDIVLPASTLDEYK